MKPLDASYSNSSHITAILSTILPILDSSIDLLCGDIETIDEDLHLHDHAIIVNSLLLSIYSIVQQHGDDSSDSEELLLVASFALSDT